MSPELLLKMSQRI